MVRRVVARLEKGKKRFEIIVDGVKAWEFREGKNIPIDEILLVEEIFTDANKGLVPKEEDLKSIFGTTDVYKIAEQIIKHGEVPMPQEYREKLLNEKKKQIIDYIVRNAIDPRTKLPIPPQRVEAALEKAKVRIDPFKPVEAQIKEIIPKLQLILPLSFEKRKLEIIIPAQYTGKLYGYISSLKPQREDWLEDGSLRVIVEVPAGSADEIIEKISISTRGSATVIVHG